LIKFLSFFGNSQL
jgi:hypothetical protein